MQTTSNQRPNRTNPVHGSDVTQSLSASDAADRLGVSVSTVKRMCSEGKLASFRTRGPRGHLRIPVEALEKIRQGAAETTAPSGSVVATKRANLEETRLELEERKLKRDLSKMDAEDSAAARERAAAQRTQRLAAKIKLRELKLQAARDDERRRTAAREEERKRWRHGWIRGVENEIAREFAWLSTEQEAAVKITADVELDRFDIEDAPEIIGPALDRAIERTVRPWRAEREEKIRRDELIKKTIEGYTFWTANPEQRARAAADVRATLSQLPLGVSDVELHAVIAKAVDPVKREIEDNQTRRRRDKLIESAARSLPWNSTESEKTQALDAVRSALSRVPLQANQAGEQDIVARALAPIKRIVEDRWAAQQEVGRRAPQKSLLISIAVLDASNYLDEMNEDGEIEFDPGEDLSDVSQKISAAVRDGLGKELTGSESQEEANRIAREIVDEELG